MRLPAISSWFGVLLLALLSAGCATCPQSHPLPFGAVATMERLNIEPTHYILTVNIARQKLSLYEGGQLVRRYPCSTSRFGIGEVLDSQDTPRGLHRIVEKIGDGEPAGTIFVDRVVVGKVGKTNIKDDAICTRIMWLEGLEPGFNQGGNVDTHDRLIYIHGTADQYSLGRPASHGCIHLADRNLIPLFDLLPSGTLVWIVER